MKKKICFLLLLLPVITFAQNIDDTIIGNWAVYPTHNLDYIEAYNIYPDESFSPPEYFMEITADGRVIKSHSSYSIPVYLDKIRHGEEYNYLFVYPDFASDVYFHAIDNDLIIMVEKPIPPYPILNAVFIYVLKRDVYTGK